jgi:hypothetical protein
VAPSKKTDGEDLSPSTADTDETNPGKTEPGTTDDQDSLSQAADTDLRRDDTGEDGAVQKSTDSDQERDIEDAEVVGEPAESAAPETVQSSADPGEEISEAEAKAEAGRDDTDAAEPGDHPDTDPEPDSLETGAAAGTAETASEAPWGERTDSAPEPEAPVAEPARADTPPPQAEPQRSGVMPMVLGGVVAAGVGFAAAYFGGILQQPDPEIEASLQAQEAAIAELSAQIADATETESFDPTSLNDAIAALDSRLGATESAQADFAERLAALDARLSAAETAPLEGAVSDEAVAAYERDLAALRETIAQSRAEIEAIAEEVRASAATAAAQAILAENRTALAEILAALQAGQPYDEPIGVLTSNDVAVPPALAEPAPEGLVSAVELAESFPPAARAALAAARETEGGDDGFRAFLAAQLGARSVTPREGDEADAVLSRAESALRVGDLDAALQELTALPEAARNAMGDWLGQAEMRNAALAAAGTLADDLGQARE